MARIDVFSGVLPGPVQADVGADAGVPTVGLGSSSGSSVLGDPTPMRQPRQRRRSLMGATTALSGDTGSLPPLWVIAMNRIGFGPRPGDAEAFEQLGTTDDARLDAFIEQQLYPESIDDAEVDARLAAGGFKTLGKTRQQLWFDHHTGPITGPVPTSAQRLEPFWETERATFIRAIYSRRQLAAVLADFWHNHFNIFGPDHWTAALWVHYDRDIIRANALGNFRKMLEDVATSFPMLMYLDGYTNMVNGPNENFARELFELHGLGAENYLGVRRQDEVPRDARNLPVGYVDDDVYESTRAFTGWGVDFGTGEFRYYPERHDRFQKHVLGRFLRSDQGSMKDGWDVLDAVANHPGTARYISRKLCRRFISDDPPERVVNEAAEVFLEQSAASDQLRQVLRVILRSPEFRTTWGQKVKRPFEFIVSCFRAVNANLSFALYDQPSEYFASLYAQAGQALFRWATPDGYPDTREKWLGSNAFVGRWRLANWLNAVNFWWDRVYQPFDPFAAMPADVRSSSQIADFWIQRILGRPMAPASRLEVVQFMARGRDPEMPYRGFEDEDVRQRVWGTIALIMTSPENLVR